MYSAMNAMRAQEENARTALEAATAAAAEQAAAERVAAQQAANQQSEAKQMVATLADRTAEIEQLVRT